MTVDYVGTTRQWSVQITTDGKNTAGNYAKIIFDFTETWKILSNFIKIYSHGDSVNIYHQLTCGGWQFRRTNDGLNIGELDFTDPNVLSNPYTRSSFNKGKVSSQ